MTAGKSIRQERSGVLWESEAAERPSLEEVGEVEQRSDDHTCSPSFLQRIEGSYIMTQALHTFRVTEAVALEGLLSVGGCARPTPTRNLVVLGGMCHLLISFKCGSSVGYIPRTITSSACLEPSVSFELFILYLGGKRFCSGHKDG